MRLQPNRLLWWLLALGTLALLMAPLFMVDVPPLLDYPNHLARQWLLAGGVRDPILSRFYTPHWAVIPNIAVDLLMIALQRFMPVYLAGKIVLGLTIIVQFAGIAAYSRVLFARLSFWPIAFGLIGYNAILLLGFVSFALSLGLALLAAAGWVRWRENHPLATTVGLALAALFIFFCHALGVLFLGFLLSAREFDHVIGARAAGENWKRELSFRTLALVAVFLPSLLFYVALVPKQEVGNVFYYGPSIVISLFSLAFSSYSATLDALTFGAVILLVALCIGANKRALPLTTFLQLAVLVPLYFACPFRLGDEGWLNVHVIYMASLILFAGIAPVLSRRSATLVSCGVAALLCARVFVVSQVWHDYRGELAAFRQVIAPVAPGSSVLTVTLPPTENPRYWRAVPRARKIAALELADMHLPALLLIERHAFWPLLFNVPSQHAIKVQPRYLPLSVQQGELPRYEALTSPTKADLSFAPYLRNWQKNFDYVLVMNAGGIANLSGIAPGKLALLTHADIAALYKVNAPETDQLFDPTTSTRSSGPPSVAPPTAVTSIKLDETPRSIR